MNKCRIELSFNDKSVQTLAGYDYGKATYDEQILKTIDFTVDKITIIFPEYITSIASSFIEGFFDGFKRTIGINGIKEKVEIETKNENVKRKIEIELS